MYLYLHQFQVRQIHANEKNTNDLYMPCANYNAYNKSENAWVNHSFNVKSYFETDKKL